jgi:hypothetical protein
MCFPLWDIGADIWHFQETEKDSQTINAHTSDHSVSRAMLCLLLYSRPKACLVLQYI